MSDRVETEWQFESKVSPQRWLRGAALPDEFTLGAATTEDLADTYYDTDDWRVYRAGYALRVRHVGDRREATLKELGAARDGRHDRRELTTTLAATSLARRAEDALAPGDGEADVHDVVGRVQGVLADHLNAIAGTHPVRAVIELRTHRRRVPILRDGRTIGELALDATSLPAKETPAPVRLYRVEVEVAPGVDPKALEPFVDACRQSVMLVATDESKFAAALDARGIVPARLFDAAACAIDASMATGAVALASLRRYFTEMLDAEPGTRLGEHAERLHDMRVAIRRLRAMVALFEDALPRRFVAAGATLEWISGALGAVRDLDVQLDRIREWCAQLEPDDAAALALVADVLRRRRLAARQRMLRVLDCPRYEAFVARFTATLRAPLPARGTAARPIAVVAPTLIRKHMRKVRKIGDHVTAATPPATYHQLRIRSKRLRYALEAHEEVYGKPARRLVAAVTKLQDVLGRHQDAEVAMTDLRELCERRRPRLSARAIFVIGKIAERYEREAKRLRARFPKRYDAIVGGRWKRMRKALRKRAAAMPAPSAPSVVEVVRVVPAARPRRPLRVVAARNRRPAAARDA